MQLRDLYARIVQKLFPKFNKVFNFSNNRIETAKAKDLLAQTNEEFSKIFFSHEGRVVHKWTHYLGVYEKLFARFRDTDVKFLEIGVFKGGSLEIWRKYFGDRATIFGIDIDPDCANYVDKPNEFRLGSQADRDFLTSVINEMGEPDVILDDGSHIAEHQLASFKCLFPHLKEGGLYIIEDTHTAYKPGFYQGGYQRKNTAIEFSKQIVDDMHGWYHSKNGVLTNKNMVKSVSFFDSIIVIEKGDIEMPMHIMVGDGAE